MKTRSGLKPIQWSTAQKVLGLLPEDGSPISSSELKKRATEQGLGYDTLYNHLKKMENFVVLRYVDTSTRRPRVLYKRLPYEEIFGIRREEWVKGLKFFQEKLAPIFDQLFKKIPLKRRKRFYIGWQLTYFLIFPAAVEARALELEPEKRKDFIDIMFQCFFYPKLIKLANEEWITPEDWMGALRDAFKAFPKARILKLEELARTAPKKYRPEIRKLVEEISRFEKEEAHADSP